MSRIKWLSVLRSEEFRQGWRRRSACLLDYAGCPVWLVKLRIGYHRKDWGTSLGYLLALRYLDIGEVQDVKKAKSSQ